MKQIITREMIEGCLDDELNEMGWISPSGIQVDDAEIIKKLYPKHYENFILDYCDRNNILIDIDLTGKTTYIEITED